MTVPLTGTALEIHRRLEAGQDVDRITEIGRYRRSWTRADVLAVSRWRWLRESERRQDKTEPVLRPDCGTTAGWHHHQNHGERICDECQDAKREYQREWRRRVKEGGAA